MLDISMGVRREDIDLKRQVERALASRRGEIDAILAEAGVPRLDAGPPGAAAR